MHKYDSMNLSSSGWGWGAAQWSQCIPGPEVVSHLALIQMLYLVGGRQWTQVCGGEGDCFVHFRVGRLASPPSLNIPHTPGSTATSLLALVLVCWLVQVHLTVDTACVRRGCGNTSCDYVPNVAHMSVYTQKVKRSKGQGCVMLFVMFLSCDYIVQS